MAANANFEFLLKQNELLATKVDQLNTQLAATTLECKNAVAELKSTGEKILSTQTTLTKIAARVEAILAYLPLFVRKLSEWFVKGVADVPALAALPALPDVPD